MGTTERRGLRWSLARLGLGAAALLLGCEPPAPPESPPTVIYVSDIGDGEVGQGTLEDPFRSLQDAIDAAEDGLTLQVATGTYEASPSEGIDPTCGNCADDEYRSDIPVTFGFRVVGKGLQIRGESREDTVLVTGAGYGVYFEDAGSSSLESLTVTGGVRDLDGRATDAAVVVRYTELTVRDVDILENDNLYEPEPGEEDPVVGVMGITGREGARLTVLQSRVLDSSWDGIALYRSDPEVADSEPRALVIDTVVGCTRDCVSTAGRGVGIASTWDSQLEVVGCEVHDYWKGIGTFGNSSALLVNNLVRDQVGWGLIVSGESTAEVHNNVVADNGTTGLAAWNSGISGSFVNNIVTGNGWNSDEWVGKRTGVWMNGEVDFAYNDVWDNALFDMCTGYPDCTALEFEGLEGNLSVDPDYEDGTAGSIAASSPLVDAGDPGILDVDGSRSDLGLDGGPHAGRSEP